MSRSRTPQRAGGAALPAQGDKVRFVDAMFDGIAPRYDLVNRVMTFGMDRRWRRRAVAALGLPPGSRVLDLACGTGDLCRDLTAAGHAPVGIDRSAGMLAAARTVAPLVRGDALDLPVARGGVDGVTCGFALRNFAALGPCFEELARVVRPGGRLAFLEVDQPGNRVLRALHGLHFGRVAPFVGGLLSDRDAYRYLPASVAYLPDPDGLAELAEAAGFTAWERRPLMLGAVQLLTGTRA